MSYYNCISEHQMPFLLSVVDMNTISSSNFAGEKRGKFQLSPIIIASSVCLRFCWRKHVTVNPLAPQLKESKTQIMSAWLGQFHNLPVKLWWIIMKCLVWAISHLFMVTADISVSDYCNLYLQHHLHTTAYCCWSILIKSWRAVKCRKQKCIIPHLDKKHKIPKFVLWTMHVPNQTGSRLKLLQMKSYYVSSLHNDLQLVSLVLPQSLHRITWTSAHGQVMVHRSKHICLVSFCLI